MKLLGVVVGFKEGRSSPLMLSIVTHNLALVIRYHQGDESTHGKLSIPRGEVFCSVFKSDIRLSCVVFVRVFATLSNGSS